MEADVRLNSREHSLGPGGICPKIPASLPEGSKTIPGDETQSLSYCSFQMYPQNLDNSTPQNCGAEKELLEDEHANKYIKLSMNFCLQTLYKPLFLSLL